MDSEGTHQEALGRKWWQDWRWIAACAALVFSVAALMASGQVRINANKNAERDVKVEETVDNTEDIKLILEGIAENQRLIAQNQESILTNQAGIDVIAELVCASSDPVRRAACAELTPEDTP